MNTKQYKVKFIETLQSIYGPEEVESFFYLILEDKFQLKRLDLALDPNYVFSEEAIKVWEELVTQLKKEIPIQYLLGKTNFYGLSFMVNENTLIPRPETEELVDWMIQENKKIVAPKKLKILDIGTGSGCIAISLAKNLPNASVFALDVSSKALDIAKKNAEINQVSVTFLEKDILQTEDLMEQFDIIVSNPPYVRNLEKQEIKNNVLQYEPHLALFVDDFDALIFYRKIALLATKNLNQNGQLFFEINQYLGNEMIALLSDFSFSDIELKKDIYENDRMTRAIWSKK